VCFAFADRIDTSQYRSDFATSRIDFVMASFQCKGSHDCGHGKCIDMKEEKLNRPSAAVGMRLRKSYAQFLFDTW